MYESKNHADFIPVVERALGSVGALCGLAHALVLGVPEQQPERQGDGLAWEVARHLQAVADLGNLLIPLVHARRQVFVAEEVVERLGTLCLALKPSHRAETKAVDRLLRAVADLKFPFELGALESGGRPVVEEMLARVRRELAALEAAVGGLQ